MNMTIDEFEKGTLWKPGIWAFYMLSNFIGVFLNSSLIYFVYKNEKRSASDIFVGCISSGCIIMSLFCGFQCLLSLLDNHFYGGRSACILEANAHIASILTQFLGVMMLNIGMNRATEDRSEIKPETALKISVIIWVTCVIGTCLLSIVSPIYLMSAGTYCFFEFKSWAIAGWLIPGLVISLGVSFICHFKTLRHLKAMLPQTMTGILKLSNNGAMTTNKDILVLQFKWRSVLFMITLLLGWFWAAISVIYEFSTGKPATEFLVTAVGVHGVLFQPAVPLVFTFTSDSYKKAMLNVLTCKCCTERKQWQETKIILRSRSTSKTPKRDSVKPIEIITKEDNSVEREISGESKPPELESVSQEGN